MRPVLLLVFFAMYAEVTLGQQQQPISWDFTIKKLSDHIFEIHATALLQDGWHVYSSKQPPKALAIPTNLEFDTQPYFTTYGPITEIGEREEVVDTIVDIHQYQYSSSVDFVQKIQLIKPDKESYLKYISGSVEFMICNDIQCMPQKKQSFKLPFK